MDGFITITDINNVAKFDVNTGTFENVGSIEKKNQNSVRNYDKALLRVWIMLCNWTWDPPSHINGSQFSLFEEVSMDIKLKTNYNEFKYSGNSKRYEYSAISLSQWIFIFSEQQKYLELSYLMSESPLSSPLFAEVRGQSSRWIYSACLCLWLYSRQSCNMPTKVKCLFRW